MWYLKSFFHLSKFMLIYSALFFLIQEVTGKGWFLPEKSKNKDFLWSDELPSKMVELTQNLRQPDLVTAFVTNQTSLDTLDKNLFRDFGVLHLLSLSGAQLQIIASILTIGLGSLLQVALLPFHSLSPWSRQERVRSVIIPFRVLCISYIVIALGASGALLRSLFFVFLFPLLFSHLIFYFKLKIVEPVGFVGHVLGLIFYSFLFGNPFLDVSFILSAFGGECVKLFEALTKKNENPGAKRLLRNPIIETICVSLLINALLWPLQKVDFLKCLVGNLVGGFVVNLVVTPLSTVVIGLLLLNLESWVAVPLQLLDMSLTLFLDLMNFLKTGWDQLGTPGEFSTKSLLFSHFGLNYMGWVLVILWSSQAWIQNELLTTPTQELLREGN